MALNIQIGKVSIRPTETEQTWLAAGAGGLALGWLLRSRTIAAVGALAIAGVALAIYEEAETFVAPETMNGYFKTGGKLSAVRGPADALILAGLAGGEGS
jgi:hypothetical protein